MNLLKELRNVDHFTKTEQRLLTYIDTNPEKIIYGTITELSHNAGVGEATIIRLCKKLNLSGFSDLKIELAKDSLTSPPSHIEKESYLTTSANLLKDAITKTEKLVIESDINKAIRILSDAKSIYLFGVGHSGESARDYAKTWFRVGLVAHAEVDPHFQVQIASFLNSKDVVVALSLSGHTKDIYDSVRLAKKRGAHIIVITNDFTSPIANLADVTLRTAVSEFLNIGSVSGQVSQLYICEILAKGYENYNHIDTTKLKERALKAIMNKSM